MFLTDDSAVTLAYANCVKSALTMWLLNPSGSGIGPGGSQSSFVHVVGAAGSLGKPSNEDSNVTTVRLAIAVAELSTDALVMFSTLDVALISDLVRSPNTAP